MLKKVSTITGMALILLALAGGALYWYWTKTPLYSLRQAQQAFEKHNLAAFEKYVDVKTLIGRMLDQVQAPASSGAAKKSGDAWGQLVQTLTAGLEPMVKPQLAKRLQEQLEVYVVKGKFEVAKNGSVAGVISLHYIYQMAGGDNVRFRSAAYVKEKGKIAIVGLRLYHKTFAALMILELKLRNRGGYWQVSEFNNLHDYMKKLDELKTKHGNGAGKTRLITKMNKVKAEGEKSHTKAGIAYANDQVIRVQLLRQG